MPPPRRDLRNLCDRGLCAGRFLVRSFRRIGWLAHDAITVMKAEVSQSERSLAVGASVLAADGSKVGSLSGISRRDDGHIERIRVITASLLAWGKGLSVSPTQLFL